MTRLQRRFRRAFALAICASLVPVQAQAADPLDYTAATVVNAGDQHAATSAYLSYAAGSGGSIERASNVTCGQPRAYPYETTKYQNLIVGSLHQHDTVAGEAHCVSFTNQTYTCRLTMVIDYFVRSGLVSGTWYPTEYRRTYYGVTVGGVCDAAGVLDVIYPDTHVAVNKPRRVRAFVYTSVTGTAPVAQYVSHTYGL